MIWKLCILTMVVNVVQPEVTVKSSYTTKYKCDNYNGYAAFHGKSLTLTCNHSLPKADIKVFEWYKGTNIVFDYSSGNNNDEAYIKGDFIDRTKYNWINNERSGVNIIINILNKTIDQKKYKCQVEKSPQNTGVSFVDLTNKIFDLPTKQQLNQMLSIQNEKVHVPKENDQTILSASATNDQAINCSNVNINWNGTFGKQECQVDENYKVTCTITIKTEKLEQGKEYTYKVQAELYGVKSDEKEVKVTYGSSGPSLGLIIGIIVAVVVALLIILVVAVVLYRKKSRNSKRGMFSANKHDPQPEANKML